MIDYVNELLAMILWEVELKPFDRRFVGSNPALAATKGPWTSKINSQLPVALWHEIPAQYLCCVGSA